MKECTEVEKGFAISLFELLKDRKIDDAQNITEDFFDLWSPGSKKDIKSTKSKSAPKSTTKDPQSSLEVFK
jgi:hypothetical protein